MAQSRFCPSRLASIRTLKEKVIELQKELKRIETTEVSPARHQASRSPQKAEDRKYQTLSINTVNTTTPTRFKNPNFWGSNPIIGDKNYQQRSPKSSKSPGRFSPSRPSSELVREVMRNTSNEFYKSGPNPQHQMFAQTCKNLGSHLRQSRENLQNANPQGYASHGSVKALGRLPLEKIENENSRSPDRNTPRFKKVSAIRTFIQRNVDPILRPPMQKKTNRKVCHARNQSPLNMLTEHQKSNTRMYISPSKAPIFLSPQNRSCRKNKSDILKALLNQSAETSTPKDSQGKKHFACHFQETLRNMVYL